MNPVRKTVICCLCSTRLVKITDWVDGAVVTHCATCGRKTTHNCQRVKLPGKDRQSTLFHLAASLKPALDAMKPHQD